MVLPKSYGIANGWPLAPGQAPRPPLTLQTLALSTSTFALDAPMGAVLADIGGRTEGGTVVPVPNDGRLVVDGDQLKRGPTAWSVGALPFSLEESHPLAQTHTTEFEGVVEAGTVSLNFGSKTRQGYGGYPTEEAPSSALNGAGAGDFAIDDLGHLVPANGSGAYVYATKWTSTRSSYSLTGASGRIYNVTILTGDAHARERTTATVNQDLTSTPFYRTGTQVSDMLSLNNRGDTNTVEGEWISNGGTVWLRDGFINPVGNRCDTSPLVGRTGMGRVTVRSETVDNSVDAIGRRNNRHGAGFSTYLNNKSTTDDINIGVDFVDIYFRSNATATGAFIGFRSVAGSSGKFCNDFTVRNCGFEHVVPGQPPAGLNSPSIGPNCVVDQCTFRNWRTIATFRGSGGAATNNYGFKLWSSDVFNCTPGAFNVTIEDNFADTFVGNSAVDHQDAVQHQGLRDGEHLYLGSIQRNVFVNGRTLDEGATVNGWRSGQGIFFSDSAGNCGWTGGVIANNIFYLELQDSLWLSNPEGVTITRNTCQNRSDATAGAQIRTWLQGTFAAPSGEVSHNIAQTLTLVAGPTNANNVQVNPSAAVFPGYSEAAQPHTLAEVKEMFTPDATWYAANGQPGALDPSGEWAREPPIIVELLAASTGTLGGNTPWTNTATADASTGALVAVIALNTSSVTVMADSAGGVWTKVSEKNDHGVVAIYKRMVGAAPIVAGVTTFTVRSQFGVSDAVISVISIPAATGIPTDIDTVSQVDLAQGVNGSTGIVGTGAPGGVQIAGYRSFSATHDSTIPAFGSDDTWQHVRKIPVSSGVFQIVYRKSDSTDGTGLAYGASGYTYHVLRWAEVAAPDTGASGPPMPGGGGDGGLITNSSQLLAVLGAGVGINGGKIYTLDAVNFGSVNFASYNFSSSPVTFTGQEGTAFTYLDFNNAHGIVLENAKITGKSAGNVGIFIRGGSSTLTFNGVYFNSGLPEGTQNGGTAFRVANGRSFDANIRFNGRADLSKPDVLGYSFAFAAVESNGVTITDAVIGNCGHDGINFFGSLNCTADHCFGRDLYVNPGEHPDFIQWAHNNTTRAGNIVIKNCGYVRGNGGAAQGYFGNACDGVTVEGCWGHGMMFNSISASDCTNITFVDNFLQSTPEYGSRVMIRGGSDTGLINYNYAGSFSDYTEPADPDADPPRDALPNTNITIGANNVAIGNAELGDYTELDAWLATRPDAIGRPN